MVKTTPVLVRRYARQLGYRLELEPKSGEIAIAAYEIQTGVRVTDLPGMEKKGFWRSWSASKAGLCALKKSR